MEHASKTPMIRTLTTQTRMTSSPREVWMQGCLAVRSPVEHGYNAYGEVPVHWLQGTDDRGRQRKDHRSIQHAHSRRQSKPSKRSEQKREAHQTEDNTRNIRESAELRKSHTDTVQDRYEHIRGKAPVAVNRAVNLGEQVSRNPGHQEMRRNA